MKIRLRLICATLTVASASLAQNTVPPAPVPGTRMTEEYVQQVGRWAYFWAWPMVNVYNRVAAFSQLPEPGLMGGIVPVAPPNQLSMLTDYVAPEERIVACPNQDVVYGFSVLSLDREPVVIQVPDFGDRFWVYQVVDQRTDSFASLGKMYGTKPGLYLLVGPDWKERAPSGIKGVFRSSTNLGVVIPRVFKDATEADTKAVQPLINQIMLYPLSQSDGTMKTKDWSSNRRYPSSSEGQAETKWVVPEKFVGELPKVMDGLHPLPGEQAMYANIRSVWAAAENDPNLKQALEQAVIAADKELVQPVFEFRNFGIPVAGNWTTQINGAKFGTDYFTRTAVAKSNIFVNKSEETKYFYQDLDSRGGRLKGNHRYTVTFAKGSLPPVKGFWSLTLYNKFHFFEPNSLKRYSLGTKNQNLQLGPDGSLTIYVSATPPNEGNLSNWLPAPKDEFSLFFRCYWPGEPIMNGEWTPPPAIEEPSNGPAKAQEPPAPPLVEQLNNGNWLSQQEAEALRDELFYQRAVHAYMTMLPALNIIGMRDGSEGTFGKGYNILPIWKDRMDSRAWVPTPNADVIYSMSYLDLKESGPLVVAAPPNVIGMFTDFFQRTITDVGAIGPDRARGGLYLLLPPDYGGAVPAGYFSFKSPTYNVFLFFRTVMKKGKDGPDPAPAVALAEQTRVYPLWAMEKDVKPMQFPNGSGKQVNMMYPVDNTYWTKLKDFVDYEPVSAIDPELRGVLASIGIIKGQAFEPTERQQELLKKAVETAPKMIMALRQLGRTDSRNLYYKDRQYENVWAGATSEWLQDGYLDVNERSVYFQVAYASAPAMVMRTLNAGSKYPFTIRDAQGDFLNGSNTYKLHLPPDPPAALFWAVTAYNITDGTMVEAPQLLPSINGFNNVATNTDGSVDLWFAPEKPADAPDSNWIQTVNGRNFLVALRLYGTGVEFFDQSWKPDDVVKVR